MSIDLIKNLSLAKAIRESFEHFTRRLIVYIFTPKSDSCHISEGGGELLQKLLKPR
jgi:hypothetical protein